MCGARNVTIGTERMSDGTWAYEATWEPAPDEWATDEPSRMSDRQGGFASEKEAVAAAETLLCEAGIL